MSISRFSPAWRVALLPLALLLGGCGGSSAKETYAAKCAVGCKAPATGPCAGQDEAACNAECLALTEGLKPECVQCIVENSGWKGLACTCYGKPCTVCGFSPGDDACHSPAPGEECTTAQEKCTGYTIQRATGDECTKLCTGSGGDARPSNGTPTADAR